MISANPTIISTTTKITTTISTTTETSTTSTTTETSTTSTTTETSTTSTTTETTTTETSTNSAGSVSTCLNANVPSFNTGLYALWRLDSNTDDDKGLHDGTMMGNANFSQAGYINGAMYFPTMSMSYIAAPYVDLIPSDFTIELWMRVGSFTPNNMALVSQNDLKLRVSTNGRVYLDPTPSLVGTQLVANVWYHIALAYNSGIEQPYIYINGILDTAPVVSFYSTTSSTFYIGVIDGMMDYFNGEIDHVSITSRAKTACEILRDVTLLGSYSFTSGSQALDSGPYGNTGVISPTIDPDAGVIGDGLFYDGSITSYFQASGMTGLATVNGEFSFTLFVKPTILRDCSLIFLSGTNDISDTNQSRPYLGLTASRDIVVEIPPTMVLIAIPQVSAYEWGHIAVTYSFPNNKVAVYYNGTLMNSWPGPPSYYPAVRTPPVYVTLGNGLGGPNGSIIKALPFAGYIDEFNIWSRELNASEVYAAAHP